MQCLKIALSKLLITLQEARDLPSSEEELNFLNELLKSKELHALVKVHNKILTNGASPKFFPILSTSLNVMYDVLDDLSSRLTVSEDCRELAALLHAPHIQVEIL